MFAFVSFQSCAVSLATSLASSDSAAASCGAISALCFCIAGIIALVARKQKTKTINYVCAGFYWAVYFFSRFGMKDYSDLEIWGYVSFAFGCVFILTIARTKKRKNIIHYCLCCIFCFGFIMNKRDSLFYILNIILPIVIGAIIYVLYSPNTVFVQLLNNYFIIKNLDSNVVSNVLRNYFCDFCWSYSLAFTISFIYKDSFSLTTSILVPISVGIMLEILQLTKIISGTYDILDIISELLACIICYLILVNRNKKRRINL